MKKLNASLLMMTLVTGVILAGCNQKPATEEKKPGTESVSGSITIKETPTKDVTGTISITPEAGKMMDDASKAMDSATKATDSAVDSAKKAMDDAGVVSAEAKKAMDDANAAMMKANEDSKAAMEAATKAMNEAKQ